MEGNRFFEDTKPIKIDDAKGSLIGFPVGFIGNMSTIPKLMSFKHSPGWIVQGDKVAQWNFTRIIETNGETYLCGPFYEGISFYEIFSLDIKKILEMLLKLVEALIILKTRSINYFSIFLDSVRFLKNGEILFFPPNIMEQIMNSRSEKYRINANDIINHPDKKGEGMLSFMISTILYKGIVGDFPFKAHNEEDIHSKIRKHNILPPSMVVPELRDEVSIAIFNSMNKGEGAQLALTEWQKKLEKWVSFGVFKEVSVEEKKNVLFKAKKLGEKIKRDFRLKTFIQKNVSRIISVLAILIVIGMFTSFFVSRAFSTRRTKGFTPEMVVKSFYLSTNILDYDLMEDCVVKNVGKDYINETVMLSFMLKKAMAYGADRSPVIFANKWGIEGKPVVKFPDRIYGILELKIEKIGNLPGPTFIVTYEKWDPIFDDDQIGGSDLPYRGFLVKEKVMLEIDRKDWVMSLKEEISRDPIKINIK